MRKTYRKEKVRLELAFKGGSSAEKIFADVMVMQLVEDHDAERLHGMAPQGDLERLVQAELETSTLRELGPRVASRNQMMIWFGGRWTPSPRWAFEFGLGEDLIAKSAADFTAWLGLEWRIGAGRRLAPRTRL